MLYTRFNKSVISIAIASLLLPIIASAEEVNEKEIETISVWGTQVRSSSLYVQGEDLANKQADHISDLLRVLPGIDVGGAHSLNQRITIRGMDDKDLKISIDGASQNSYMYHHMGNLQIHADILKSVDIEVGTNSIINGGLGGAVRFKTKNARDLLINEQSFGGRVQVNASTNSGSNYSLTGYGLVNNNVDFLVYHNGVNNENYEVGGGKIKDFEGNKISGTDGNVRGLEGEVNDTLIKFGWDITKDQRIQLSYETYQDKGNYSYRPDMGLATDLAITNSLEVPLLWPTEFTRDTVTLNYELVWGDSSTLDIVAFSNTSELWRDETGYAENPAYTTWAAIVTGEAKNIGFNILGTTDIEGDISQALTYGIDVIKYKTNYQAAYASSTDMSNEESTNKSIFAQTVVDFGNGFTFTPGVRYDHFDVQSSVVDNTFSDISFSLAGAYQVTDNLVLKLSSTELFKSPELGEVFTGAGLYERENAAIEAEKGTNTEFSLAFQVNDLVSLGGTYFVTNIENFIYDYAAVPNGGDRDSWKDNVGDMEVKGFELYVGYQAESLSSQLSYSSAESELNAFADYQVLDKSRIDREQGDTISAEIGYEFSDYNVSVHWEMMHVSDVEDGLNLDGASKNNAKDSFTVQNIQARWDAESIDGLTVIVGVDNLFDEFYASQSSRTGLSSHPRFGDLYLVDYEPGRNIKATVSYSF